MRRSTLPLSDSLSRDEGAVNSRQLPLPPPFAPPRSANAEQQFTPVQPLTVLTIGHGSLESEVFLALLRQHAIATVADVRSIPYSRYAPQFSRDVLQALLGTARIRYVWVGDTL